MDLDDAKTSGGSDRAPDVPDLVEVYKLPPKKWVTLRFRMGIFSTARYWIKTQNKQGKGTKFPTVCPSYNIETQERDADKYDPWRDVQRAEYDRAQDGEVSKEEAREQAHVQFEQKFWMQAIVRGLQKTEPAKKPKHTKSERETGFKDKDSDSWTPQKAIRLGKSFADKIKKLKGLNVVESKSGATKAFPVNDDRFGCDIRVMYDPDAAPADQYQVQIGDRKRLTEEELEYLGQDLETACTKAMECASDKEIKRDFDSWASRNKIKIKGVTDAGTSKNSKKSRDDDDGDDDNGDDDDTPKKSNKKQPPKSSGKKRQDDDDGDGDDDNSDDGDDFGDDDDDDTPKKGSKNSKKQPPKSNKRGRDDDDGDGDDDNSGDDDGDGDDFDDDDTPKKSNKSSKKPAGKSSKKDDDDGDGDDGDDFGDDDDDDTPKKSNKKPASKKSSKDDDGDGDDDFGDDDDDKPAPKKGGKSSSSKKSSKDDDDGDDFDDDNSGDDDGDGDDDPPPKKSNKSSSSKGGKTSSKRSSKDDDDDF